MTNRKIKSLSINSSLEQLSLEQLSGICAGSKLSDRLVCPTYTQAMGLKEGDKFEIKLGYKHIHLKQLDGSNSHFEEELTYICL